MPLSRRSDFASPFDLNTLEQTSDQHRLCAPQAALTGLGLPPEQELEARGHCEPLLGPLHPVLCVNSIQPTLL